MKLHPHPMGERGTWRGGTWEAGERQGSASVVIKVLQIDSTNKNKTKQEHLGV